MITLDIWDADDCATYLRMSRKHFLERIATLPTFPKPSTLPMWNRTRLGRTGYRWEIEAVRAWRAKHMEPAQPTPPNVRHDHASA